MSIKETISSLLSEMTSNHVENAKILEKGLSDLGIATDDFLLTLTTYCFDEILCYEAIESLVITEKYDLNKKDSTGCNFIHKAIYSGYGEDFITAIVNLASYVNVPSQFDFNSENNFGHTILHSAICCDEYDGNLLSLYKELKGCGFNSFDVSIDIIKFLTIHKLKVSEDEFNEIKMIYKNEKKLKEFKEGKISNEKNIKIDDLLEKMDEDALKKNVAEIDNYLKSKFDYDKELFLFSLTSLDPKQIDEKKCLVAVKSLLKFGGCNANKLIDGKNFVQNAIIHGYSDYFVEEAIKIGTCELPVSNILNVNYKDTLGKTILHTAIDSPNYKEVSNLYFILDAYGFDSRVVDLDGRNIVEYMCISNEKSNKFSSREIDEFWEMYKKRIFDLTGKYPENCKEKKNEVIRDSKTEKSIIKKMLEKMDVNEKINVKNIKSVLGDELKYENKDFLNVLVNEKYNSYTCQLAIKSLINEGVCNPNNLEEIDQMNFIQQALYTGYEESFIINMIKASMEHKFTEKLDVNHVDISSNTIIHNAIDSPKYKGEIKNIYSLLCKYGFDSRIVNEDDKNIIEAMEDSKKYTEAQIEEMKDLFEKQMYAKTGQYLYKRVWLNKKEIEELERFGKILNLKKFISSPTIGRENEIKNLMVCLAQEKKNPIIVGESGVGKTALADELAYRITKGNVPAYLNGKIILEVNPSNIVAGCKYVGEFEKVMGELLSVCKKYDVIMFIDEIHTVYGTGKGEHKSNDMAGMLKQYIDRENIKVIGTTTENEYQEYFAGDAFKRRFEKIVVKEPNDDILSKILNKVIGDYCYKSNLNFEDERDVKDIVKILIRATGSSYRVYSDKVNNPDLAISIIDKAFAFAKYYEDENISKKHFKESILYCDRIYETSRNDAARALCIEVNREKTKATKIIHVDFNKPRRK